MLAPMFRAVRRRSSVVVAVRTVFLVALAAVALSSCSGSAVPADYDSTGIDELTIPTPTLDPAALSDDVDNPWLPLVPGTSWRYERTADGGPAGTSVVTVLRRGATVGGVDGVVTLTLDRDAYGDVVATARRTYAEDGDGNVWLLAEEVTRDGRTESWQAGSDGALAGLAMPAEPRPGDGWVRAEVPRVDVPSERVLAVGDDRVEVPAGSWTDVLQTEVVEPGERRTSVLLYARGVGLVQAEDDGGGEATVLVALTAPGD
jgi:hypothetical protein